MDCNPGSNEHLVRACGVIFFSIQCRASASAFSINAHAEELRSHFVSHEGQKELEVIDIGTRYTVDFGKLAARMTDRLRDNVRPAFAYVASIDEPR